MKKGDFALIIGLLLLVYVFAQTEASASYGLIKGVVTDTQTPRPNRLAGATVTVENESLLSDGAVTVETDRAGNYEIPNLPPGEYVITTTKPGYDDSTDYVTVVAGGESFHDIRLFKTDTLVTLFQRTRVFLGLMFICLVVVIIYIISRRTRVGTQSK